MTQTTQTVSSKQGILVVIAASAIQLTLGIAYLWSLFQTGIAYILFSGNNAPAALTFSILLAGLTIGSVIGGKLAVKFGSTRKVVFAGGVILSLGFFLASFVRTPVGWLLWATYGAMGGIGMGFTYSTAIACAQKWYPHKKGFVTGLIVSALGFGGVVFTPIIELLVRRIGEFSTFQVLALIFLVVCVVGSFFLKNPPEGYNPCQALKANTNVYAKVNKEMPLEQKSHTAIEMFKKPHFYLITIAFLLAVMGGQMMMAFARPIATMGGLPAVWLGVLILSLFNSIGRLTWGLASDKIGRTNTIIVLLTASSLMSLFVGLVAQSIALYVLMAFIGFFYGGIIGTFPSLTADTFGPKNMATNYGFVLLGFGAGAIISSQIAGVFANRAETASNVNLMIPAFIIGAVCATVGALLIVVLKLIVRQENKVKIADNDIMTNDK
ncbi:MAG: OFA family MFS transporter [Firmicutes bacterium]|nr:OFA family MFS transporter [Bacillota bacterium]